MKQRGKKSASSGEIVDLSLTARPRPPEDLLEAEANLWNEITASRPADFFDVASIPMLVEFCRTKTELDFIAESINVFDPEWLKTDDGLKRYDKLTTMRKNAQTRFMALATKMRLTQQARYVPHSKNNRVPTQSGGRKPWESD